jgi:succinate dehydrogenase/fumarate reductase flavoprotein subunit
VFGWIAGENSATYAKHRDHAETNFKDQLEENESLLLELRNRKVGPDWRETNIALQQIMWDYAGLCRSETLLDAGERALFRMKEKAKNSMIARNTHELMRCLEVLNMIDIGELLFITAKERRETRGKHIRADYPFTNPLLEKLLVIKKTDKGPKIEWRQTRK